jgi:hypothetical protein
MSLQSGSQLTPSEAGFVLERPPAEVNKAVDEGVIDASVTRAGKNSVRTLGPAELRFLKIEKALHKDFTPAGRKKFYFALKRMKDGTPEVSIGFLKVDLRDVDRGLAARLERLEALKDSVETWGPDDPLIRGTQVNVYVIAALARGQSVEEIGEDYPNLTREQIETAIDYAKAYPKRGRPYPARSLKRALSDWALHELELERTAEGPRRIDP